MKATDFAAAISRTETVRFYRSQLCNSPSDGEFKVGQYVHFMRFAPKGDDYALDRYRTQVRRALEALEKRLAAVPFLGGQSYSIADIATYPWVRNVGPSSAGRRRRTGLGRNDHRPGGGSAGFGGGRGRACQDDPVRQGRRRSDGSPLRPRPLRRLAPRPAALDLDDVCRLFERR